MTVKGWASPPDARRFMNSNLIGVGLLIAVALVLALWVRTDVGVVLRFRGTGYAVPANIIACLLVLLAALIWLASWRISLWMLGKVR